MSDWYVVGAVPSQRAALAVCDFLTAQKISAQPTQYAEQIVIVVNNEADLEPAKRVLEEFLNHPNDPRFLAASWQTGKSIRSTSKANGTSIWRQLWRSSGWVTRIVSVLAILVTLLILFVNNQLIYWFNFNLEQITSGQIYRLITPIFMHFPVFGSWWMHLVFNLVWWWWLGGRIEQQVGSATLTYHVAIIALASNLAQSWATVEEGVFGGLSGVCLGAASYMILRHQLQTKFQSSLPLSALLGLGIYIAIGFTGILGSTANAAHCVGFLTGMVLALLDVKVFHLKLRSVNRSAIDA